MAPAQLLLNSKIGKGKAMPFGSEVLVIDNFDPAVLSSITTKLKIWVSESKASEVETH